MKNIVLNLCLLLVALLTFYMIAAFSRDVSEYNRLLSVQWCKKEVDGVSNPPDDLFSYYGVYIYAQKSDAGDITVKVKAEDIRRVDIWQLHRISGSTEIATEPDMDSAIKKWGSIFCKDGGSYVGESRVYIPYVFYN
ncbi:hypothetical protein [Klebsiella spallanzanii]|uniref:hypothetical protein n=1 Tax=Klebsiella spallanzanii TaxID=2587528 RepID=UPI001159DEE1|nr:hypothetical protein [Klebsiella spallanzanii]VUS31142.1 hypothetical protein SB6419_02213 [Klebsiella spallanzanii]